MVKVAKEGACAWVWCRRRWHFFNDAVLDKWCLSMLSGYQFKHTSVSVSLMYKYFCLVFHRQQSPCVNNTSWWYSNPMVLLCSRFHSTSMLLLLQCCYLSIWKKYSPLSSNIFLVIEATVVLESTEQFLLCSTSSCCWLDVLAFTFLIAENTLGLYWRNMPQ